jgi:hypothetical protein
VLEGLFPTLPIDREVTAVSIYTALFADLPISSWTRQGTLITRYVNGKKLNFAARRHHCTIGFQGHAVIEFYRFIGGDCPVGEVTIKPPYEGRWDAQLIVDAIDWYACN